MFEKLTPVKIETGLYQLVRAAIFHRQGEVRAFVLAPEGPRLMLQGRVVDHEEKSLRHHLIWVEDDEGQSVWDVRVQGGCGCKKDFKGFTITDAMAW